MKYIFLFISLACYSQEVLVDKQSLDNYLESKTITIDSAMVFTPKVVSGNYVLQATDANNDVIIVAEGANIEAIPTPFKEGNIIRIVTLSDKQSTVVIDNKTLKLRYYPSGVTLIKAGGQLRIISFNGHIKGL